MRSKHSLVAALPILALLVTASHVRSQTPAAVPAPPPTIQYPSHISAGHSAPPAGVLTNPYQGNKDMAAAGTGLFASMNCDGCHGGGATGFAAPSLADGRWRYGGADEEIFQSIYYGRPKGMPAFGGVLGTDGIWILVTYLQSLPIPDTVPTQSWEGQVSSAAFAAATAAEPSATSAANTANPEELLKEYACIACHSESTKLVGPSYKDIAAKYRTQKDAEKMLSEKVKNGSKGVWGQMPMPPNAAIPDRDLQVIIKWVLSLK